MSRDERRTGMIWATIIVSPPRTGKEGKNSRIGPEGDINNLSGVSAL